MMTGVRGGSEERWGPRHWGWEWGHLRQEQGISSGNQAAGVGEGLRHRDGTSRATDQGRTRLCCRCGFECSHQHRGGPHAGAQGDHTSGFPGSGPGHISQGRSLWGPMPPSPQPLWGWEIGVRRKATSIPHPPQPLDP